MKTRYLLSLALLASSLLCSPGGSRSKHEIKPKVFDGGGVPCIPTSAPSCPPGFGQEGRNA
ncbi:MAG: hypothetical protein LAP21_16230 [Acidobacteriia bacterium]|nr:hypothetical protein [Terriglobia bacterium]